MDFQSEDIASWQGFLDRIRDLSDDWVFRGQTSNNPLKTTLERACSGFNISLDSCQKMEKKMIRDFRRRYKGPDLDTVKEDTLYCMSLMQHHGAPTRLLDCTYSPYVAAYFALQKCFSDDYFVLWCFNSNWCLKQAKSIAGAELIDSRNIDQDRNDISFQKLFMRPKPLDLVFIENPFSINERLSVQQGAFLCPANISNSFECNLKSMDKWDDKNSIVKIKLKFKSEEHRSALKNLYRMNITEEALFPGLDGFSRSIKHNLLKY